MTSIDYPALNHHFRLDIPGLGIASFSECTGLSAEVGTEDYAEGGENTFVYKLPTRRTLPNLVLRRGVTQTPALWAWFAEFTREGMVSPRDGEVHLLELPGHDEAAVRVWKFVRAYPVKFNGPELNAQSTAVAIESLELVHHGLDLVEPQTGADGGKEARHASGHP